MIFRHSKYSECMNSDYTWLSDWCRGVDRVWQNNNKENKAFIDIRLRPGIWPPLAPNGSLRPNVTSSINPEVHNISQRRQRRTKPRPQGICAQNLVKIGPAVLEIYSRTDIYTQTDRRVDHNIPHSYRGGAITALTVMHRVTGTHRSSAVTERKPLQWLTRLAKLNLRSTSGANIRWEVHSNKYVNCKTYDFVCVMYLLKRSPKLDSERWTWSWSRFLGSQPAGNISHKPCRYFPPGPRLPFQSKRSPPWQVPNYTAWRQRHTGKVASQGHYAMVCSLDSNPRPVNRKSVRSIYYKWWEVTCTRESKGDVIAIRVVRLYHVDNSVERSVLTDKYVFHDDLEMYLTLRRKHVTYNCIGLTLTCIWPSGQSWW